MLKLSSAHRIGLGLIAVAFIGCTTTEPTTNEPATNESSELVITDTANGIAGSFGETTFTSEMVSEHILEITLQVNGMMITALVDYSSGVMEFDGYARDTGENTQMTDEDRTALVELEHALASLGEGLPFTLDKLRGFVATWSEHPTTVDLQTIRITEENRSWTSLCYAKNTYYPAKHDCNAGGFDTDQTTLDGAYLDSTGDLGGPDGTAFYFPYAGSFQCCSGSVSCSRYSCSVGGAGWYLAEVDHDTRIEYAWGNCFGACGGGCSSTYQFTVDCVNHDGCVRNGHVLASGYCDDQFTAASDDWASAPNCGP
jgi:hypothetical protein